jgi:hypothetical protein
LRDSFEIQPKGARRHAAFVVAFLLALRSGAVPIVDSWYRVLEMTVVATLSIGAIVSMIRNRRLQVDSYGWIRQVGRKL